MSLLMSRKRRQARATAARPAAQREIGVEDGWFEVSVTADFSFDEVK